MTARPHYNYDQASVSLVYISYRAPSEFGLSRVYWAFNGKMYKVGA